MALLDRIDLLIGEEDEKLLTKKQQKLPDKLKKAIIKKKKKKNEEIDEDAGLFGCGGCGTSFPAPSLPASCPSCGTERKRSYSFKRSTPGRKKKKPNK